MGGFIGTVFLGVFASSSLNPAGADGLLKGNSTFFFKQLTTASGAAIYAFFFTYAMLWIINKITIVRVCEEHEGQGLDRSLHDEDAYA
jgi:Amt family ammonium transporter